MKELHVVQVDWRDGWTEMTSVGYLIATTEEEILLGLTFDCYKELYPTALRITNDQIVAIKTICLLEAPKRRYTEDK